MQTTTQDVLGKHVLPNGWTVSVIGHGMGSAQGLLEAWAWDADGHAPEDPKGWMTPAEVEAFVAEVAAR